MPMKRNKKMLRKLNNKQKHVEGERKKRERKGEKEKEG